MDVVAFVMGCCLLPVTLCKWKLNKLVFSSFVHAMPGEASEGNEDDKAFMGLLDESKGILVELDLFLAKRMNYFVLSMLLAFILPPVSALM